MVPVMIELGKVCPLSQIQHNMHVLIPLLKAYRAVAELVWTDGFRLRQQPVYTNDREAIFAIAKQVLPVLPKNAKVERGILISPAGARYEVACLEQTAKCLVPTDKVWKQFIEPVSELIGSGAAAIPEGKIDMGALLKALLKIAILVKKEWISKWYIDLFPLEWEATTITDLQQFETVRQHIADFTEKGGKYTLGLVKILTIIFQNQTTNDDLKAIIIEELTKLVTVKARYSLKEMAKHPPELFSKIIRHPDRYAETRSFAAMALLDLAAKPENKKYGLTIRTAIEAWNAQVKDKKSKKYVAEKTEAHVRAEKFNTDMVSLEKRLQELQILLEDSVLGPSRTGEEPVDIEAVASEINKKNEEQQTLNALLQECDKEMTLADAFEAQENSESNLVDEILSSMKE